MKENIQREKEQRDISRHRKSSPNKKKCAKALSTLGLDLSMQKATQVLGVDEDTLKVVQQQEEDDALSERRRRRRQSKALLHNKKRNRKALNVIGYDPSLGKVLDVLGVEEGTQEEETVGEIIEEKWKKPPPPHISFTPISAVVCALSLVILFVPLCKRL